MDCSPPGSSLHEISLAGILEWVTISFSRGSFWPKDWTQISCVSGQILYHLSHWEALSLFCNLVDFSLCFSSFLSLLLGYLVPKDSDGKVSACNSGDLGSIPESGRSPGEGRGNSLQYSCLENPMNRGDNPWDHIDLDTTKRLTFTFQGSGWILA